MLAPSKARADARPAFSRRPASGPARRRRAVSAQADDGPDDLFRLQQELLSQIEDRKSRQADLEEKIKQQAVSRGVNATIDLDEEYRKTLAKFKATPGLSESKTTNATLAPPAPTKTLSKPASSTLPKKPAPVPPSVPATKLPSSSSTTSASSNPPPMQTLQPTAAFINSPPAGVPSRRNRPVVIPGKPTLPGAEATPAPRAAPPQAAKAAPAAAKPASTRPSKKEVARSATFAPPPVQAKPPPPPAPKTQPSTTQPLPKRSKPISTQAPPAAPLPATTPTTKPPTEPNWDSPPVPVPRRSPPAPSAPPPPSRAPAPPAAPAAPSAKAPATADLLKQLATDAAVKSAADGPPPEEKTPAGENAMNLVFVGAECAPWSKTGGLGDVMGSLPKAMSRRGHRVMVIAPRYGNYDDAFDTGVRQQYRVFNQDTEVGYFHCYKDGVDWIFVDHACFHNRQGGEIYKGERLEQAFRNCLLCKAALEAVWHVPCGGVPYGDSNTCFIANDWHTSLLPVYLQAHYRDHGKMTYARSVLTIHNMAYQGRGPFAELDNFEIPDHYRDHFFLDDPVGGEHMNIMKAGIITASRIVAVSGGYAWEIQTPEGGWGLHDVLQEQNWKLSGIVNGIDDTAWNPASDDFLTSDGYTQYSVENMLEGKAQNKLALQREMGLPEKPDVPLMGFVGRMDHQKGVDLIAESFHWLMGEGVQLVMLGSGREDLENDLRNMEAQRRDQCRGWVGFSVPMSHRITAACDMLLMPSRFEPCGLNQLYAMRYGTVPIVHAVGGLRETVRQFNPFEQTGTGWQFDRAESAAFRDACGNALFTFRNHREDFDKLAFRGAEQDLSWDKAAKEYEEVLVGAKFQW